MPEKKRETRYEMMRPEQLIQEQRRCSLAFLPVAGLEYHGPHLPLGVDALNAAFTAHEVCRRMGIGVVLPTLLWSTERERPGWMLENLGFRSTDWIVGMDFPSALWKSHYYQEHIFGLVLASKVKMLIQHGYTVLVIVNGHGAVNHMETIDRISRQYSRESDSLVVWALALPKELLKKELVGHADLYETSLMLYYQSLMGTDTLVDLSTLPTKDTPIQYPDYSVVDGYGFSENPDPEKIVRADPRDASEEFGKKIHEDVVRELVVLTQDALKERKWINPENEDHRP
jgi:creatinine amidohydrolase